MVASSGSVRNSIEIRSVFQYFVSGWRLGSTLWRFVMKRSFPSGLASNQNPVPLISFATPTSTNRVMTRFTPRATRGGITLRSVMAIRAGGKISAQARKDRKARPVPGGWQVIVQLYFTAATSSRVVGEGGRRCETNSRARVRSVYGVWRRERNQVCRSAADVQPERVDQSTSPPRPPSRPLPMVLHLIWAVRARRLPLADLLKKSARSSARRRLTPCGVVTGSPRVR